MANTIDMEIKRVGIIVIQSLPEPFQKTGEEVYKLYIKDKVAKDAEYFSDYKEVNTREEFLQYLKELDSNFVDGTIFTLHLETHGCGEGIYLSSEELVTWKEFYDTIRPLNVKMNNLLVVVMAMCYGAAIMSYLEPRDRAPFLCFVGSTKKESEQHISKGFKEFYSVYTSALDIVVAMRLLRGETCDENGESHFWCMKASDIFDEVMNPNREPISFSQIASAVFVNEKMKGRECTKAEIEAEMKQLMIQEANECREYFTFEDIYKTIKQE